MMNRELYNLNGRPLIHDSAIVIDIISKQIRATLEPKLCWVRMNRVIQVSE
jgi:hypothetical protein